MSSASKLYLVPTPVGNLEDITFRAVRILKEVDLVIAEDTRVSGNLLKHFGIEKPLQSFHTHNEHKSLDHYITQLQSGKSIALVSDAGTPGISDPGFLLVRACIKENIPVECLPGATAFVPALVESGFPLHEFLFIGFLPQKKGRKTQLETLKKENRTVVLYESPYRILKLLEELEQLFPEGLEVSISREISKLYAETVRGDIATLRQHFTRKEPKGEFVVVLNLNA